jgi:formyl-CoA transferase
VAEVLEALNAAQVPVGRLYTAKDIAEDPHYQARGMLLPMTTGDGLPLTLPGIVPKLSLTPGAVRSIAPALGQHQPADPSHPSVWG